MKIKWNENTCCHSGNCVNSVFAVENGQFVARPDNASEEKVREIVAACPGRALTIEED